MTETTTVELHAPGGFWGKLSGITTDNILHLIIITLLGVLIVMVKDSDNDRDKRYVGLQVQVNEMLRQGRQTQDNQQTILKALAAMNVEQQATTYVLTLNEAERKKLNLTMPDSLRNRAR